MSDDDGISSALLGQVGEKSIAEFAGGRFGRVTGLCCKLSHIRGASVERDAEAFACLSTKVLICI